MVCMGNICRSPTAEAVLRHKLAAAHLGDQVEVASAGTHAGYHLGEPPDARSTRHAKLRGYDLAPLRAKRIAKDDCTRFDLILAMDGANLDELKTHSPPACHAKLARLSDFAVHMKTHTEVPDPYQGGAAGFEHVLDLVEDACDGLIAHLRDLLKSPPIQP